MPQRLLVAASVHPGRPVRPLATERIPDRPFQATGQDTRDTGPQWFGRQVLGIAGVFVAGANGTAHSLDVTPEHFARDFRVSVLRQGLPDAKRVVVLATKAGRLWGARSRGCSDFTDWRLGGRGKPTADLGSGSGHQCPALLTLDHQSLFLGHRLGPGLEPLGRHHSELVSECLGISHYPFSITRT